MWGQYWGVASLTRFSNADNKPIRPLWENLFGLEHRRRKYIPSPGQRVAEEKDDNMVVDGCVCVCGGRGSVYLLQVITTMSPFSSPTPLPIFLLLDKSIQ